MYLVKQAFAMACFWLLGSRSNAFEQGGWLSVPDGSLICRHLQTDDMESLPGVYGLVQLAMGKIMYRALAEVDKLNDLELIVARYWSHQAAILRSDFADVLVLPVMCIVLFEQVYIYIYIYII